MLQNITVTLRCYMRGGKMTQKLRVDILYVDIQKKRTSKYRIQSIHQIPPPIPDPTAAGGMYKPKSIKVNREGNVTCRLSKIVTKYVD